MSVPDRFKTAVGLRTRWGDQFRRCCVRSAACRGSLSRRARTLIHFLHRAALSDRRTGLLPARPTPARLPAGVQRYTISSSCGLRAKECHRASSALRAIIVIDGRGRNGALRWQDQQTLCGPDRQCAPPVGRVLGSAGDCPPLSDFAAPGEHSATGCSGVARLFTQFVSVFSGILSRIFGWFCQGAPSEAVNRSTDTRRRIRSARSSCEVRTAVPEGCDCKWLPVKDLC